MNRTTQVLAFSVPPVIAREVESFAREERRSKSELFREMVKVYGRYRRHREHDEDQWILRVIAEAKAEEAIRPSTVEENLAEFRELQAWGAKKAKEMGIGPRDVNRIIHEHRQARRAKSRPGL